MKFITTNPFETPDAFAGQLTHVISDPGAFVPRIRHSESDYEPLHVWQARAVISMFQPIEASDGSAQPVVSGVSEMRALFESAKGVMPDALELQLVRGHLAEAARVFEIVRAENNQFRNYLRVAGDLLGRADADPIKLAQKVEAGIIAVNDDLRITKEEVETWRKTHVADVAKLEQEHGWLEATRRERDTFRENADDLGREVDKARRVIIGNTGGTIDDSGSLLDMLNVLIEKSDWKKRMDAINERDSAQEELAVARETIEGLREKAALHTESDGMLTQERDRAKTGLEHAQAALAGLVKIIDKAGLMNLSNGVELGQTSWYVKASDALEFARTQLPACRKCGAKSAELEDGLCGNCAPL